MRRVWLSGAIPLAVLVGCQDEAGKPHGVNLIYDEFFKALTTRYGVDGTTGNLVAHHAGDMNLGTLVLHSRTVPYAKDGTLEEPGRWDEFQWRLPSLRKDTYDDYWARNDVRHVLTLKRAGSWRLHLLGDGEHAELVAAGKRDGSGFWNTLQSRFPRSQLVSISAPGTSRDGKQVLLFLYAAYGALAQSGTYYLLEKKGGSWEITDAHVCWVS